MPHMTARQAAVQALLKVDGEGGYSNLVLNEQLKKVQLSPEDTAFASRLFYGTLERKLTLDHIIGAYSKKPVHKLTPAVAEILRMSLYQLAFLDSVPDSAAVNEGVKLTRTMKAASASGFVNAVLRAFLRDGKELPPIKGGQLRQWEVRYSCPQWIIRSLQQSYGEQAAIDFLEYSLERPPLYARVNMARGSVEACVKRLQEEGVRVQLDPDLPGCIALEQTASIERLSAFQEGLLHIQDKSSQLCAAALGAKPGERVLDCCAAPGSKSFTAAEWMGDEGEIVSCDIFAEKIKKIKQGAKRLGLSCIRARLQDATAFDPSLGQFDRVLCDAPCSGIGIIGRKPEIKYKQEQDLQDLPQVQAKILDNVSRYVKKGGTLLYSTCTLLERENGAVVQAFLKEHPEFEPAALPEMVQKACGIADKQAWKVILLPHKGQRAQTDGFFIATMKKVR